MKAQRQLSINKFFETFDDAQEHMTGDEFRWFLWWSSKELNYMLGVQCGYIKEMCDGVETVPE